MSPIVVVAGVLLAAQPSQVVTVDVDFGKDVGQNFGSLFEAKDNTGKVVAGAGFLGAYNTESRSNRRKLHFYLSPAARPAEFTLDRLPRPNSDAGVYMFDFDGRLFARSRAEGKDTRLRVWNEAGNDWSVDESTPPFNVDAGAQALTVKPQSITFGDRTILQLGPTDGRIGENYFANGCIIFRHMHLEMQPPHSELVAVRWAPNPSDVINMNSKITLTTRTPGEFVYAYGQLNEHVFAATNTGGVYSFDGKSWRVWREPSPGVSFQIYCMINFEDRLLMGQYPSGELFKFDGEHFQQLKNQPPVMKGVSVSAREAQTLAIYGGDLYAGVWPWGEVWKFDRQSRNWSLAGRVFTHPEPTDMMTHPYEAETKQLDPVLNRWGQRVTGLVPHGDALFISTSAKSSNPYESKFTFLDGGKWKDYGAVYRVRQPGNLAVQTKWTNSPTRFEFTIAPDHISVKQDNHELGSTKLEAGESKALADLKFQFGDGVYGKFRGKIQASNVANREN